VIIRPVGKINGIVDAPPSKSYTHRAFFAAYIAGKLRVEKSLICRDTIATVNALKSLGAEISWEGITSVEERPGNINAEESGTTARFALGIASTIEGKSRIDGHRSLRRRPMLPLIKSLRDAGAFIISSGYLPVTVIGRKLKKNMLVDGGISSQFVSSLLFVAAKNEGSLRVTRLVSKGYVEMTIKVLEDAGAKIRKENDTIHVDRPPRGGKIVVPGDYSSASFFLAAGALYGRIRVNNLQRHDVQPDMKIVEILEKFGAKIRRGENYVEVESNMLEGIDVDCTEHPDLFPVLAVVAAYSSGTTILRGKQLRYKESDRIRSMALELRKMGADVKEKEESLVVKGGKKLRGAVVDSHGDHRIAMALSIAALGAEGISKIEGSECVEKSYPRFFEDLRRVIDDR